MVIFKKIKDVVSWLAEQGKEGRKTGFVPTMGALHQGHVSLVERSVADGCHTVCSIFVNPTQFNDKEDLAKYPVTPEADIKLLEEAGCDVLFMPDVEEVYPKDAAIKAYEFGYLETVLEGAQRPGHFKGVGQVVGRLLEIVQPDRLYMGQKDYQQCMVVKELLSQMGLEKEIELVICPTEREADGLAMSSRNRRLTEVQRAVAGTIYQCLVSVQGKRQQGSFPVMEKECRELLEHKGFTPEYISLANADTLELLNEFDNQQPMVALVAAKLGNVRLIDNLLLNQN